MNHKEKPKYKPKDEVISSLSQETKNLTSNGFYQNSQTFPPRGSFIDIPKDMLFGPNSNLLDSIVEDKNENIDSELYTNNDQ